MSVPNDAYAFAPGKPKFSDYAGEQIAFQTQKGVAAIQDRRAPGVVSS